MNLILAALLTAGSAHAGAKGSAREPVGAPESRFALFAGAASDLEPIPAQRKLERAQALVVEELNLLLRLRAPGRYVPGSEVKVRYGKDFLPVPPVTEYMPNFKAKREADFRACDPRTAELVRGRLGVDFFAVLWVLRWPRLAGVDADYYRLDPEYRPSTGGPYIVQLFSAADCGKLAQWELSFWTDNLPRLAVDGLSEQAARDYALAAAQAIAGELDGPLRLAEAGK